MEYDNTNRGVLFKNDKKTDEKHPDYKDGADHWLNAWLAKDKNGNTYMRLSTKLKDEAHNKGMQQARAALAPQSEGFLSDDIPF
jgi:hypothetical protein